MTFINSSQSYLFCYKCWLSYFLAIEQSICYTIRISLFFFYQGFLHRHWRFTGQRGKGWDHLLFHSATSTHSRTLRHLFATLHMRWLSRIFNRNACVYQTATRWNLPPYRITIWVIDWWCSVCLFTWCIDTRLMLQRFDIENRLSLSYYKLTD